MKTCYCLLQSVVTRPVSWKAVPKAAGASDVPVELIESQDGGFGSNFINLCGGCPVLV